MLTVNALVAADSVLIPMQCEYYALEGLSALMNDRGADPHRRQPGAVHRGCAAHHVRPAQQPRQRGERQLIAHFGDKVFRTVIPRNIRLAEAPSFGKPALFHDKESRGALAYLALAGEMIRREEVASGVTRAAPAPAAVPPAALAAGNGHDEGHAVAGSGVLAAAEAPAEDAMLKDSGR